MHVNSSFQSKNKNTGPDDKAKPCYLCKIACKRTLILHFHQLVLDI